MTDGVTVAAALLVIGPVVGGVGPSQPGAVPHLVGLPRGPSHHSPCPSSRLDVAQRGVRHRDGHDRCGTHGLGRSAGCRRRTAGHPGRGGGRLRNRRCPLVFGVDPDTATPAFAELVAAGTPTEPAGHCLVPRSAAVRRVRPDDRRGAPPAVIGLALGGAVAAPVAWFSILVAVVAVVGTFVSGDVVPAVLYPPTLLIGLALLLDWA